MNKIFSILSNLKAARSINILFIISILSSLLEYLFIYLIYSTVNYRVEDVLPKSAQKIIDIFNSFYSLNSENLYLTLIKILIVIFIAKTLVGLFYNFKLSYVSQKIVYTLSDKILKISLSKNISLENKKNSSFYKNTIVVDAPMFGSSVLQPIFFIVNDLLIFFAILIFLFLAEPLVSLYISGTVLFVFLILYLIFKKRLIKWGEIREQSSLKLIQKLNEIYKGIFEIKIYNVESYFYKNIIIQLNKLRLVLTKSNFLNHFPRVILETLIFIILFIILFIELVRSEASILPYISALFAASIKLIPIISRVMTNIQNFFFARSIINKFYNLLNVNKKIKIDEKIIDQSKSKEISLIKIINLSFKYKKNIILKKINIDLKKGYPVGITGESGGGKSTIAAIIGGMINDYSGKIEFYDDKKNKLYDKTEVGLASIIPQDVFVFDDILINNLIFDKKNLAKKILEDPYNSLLKNLNINKNRKLGEDGQKISGGQRQRLGVLRSLIFDKRVLIFDESTSNLDKKNKIFLFELINFLKKDKLILIVSHDKAFLSICKKVLILKKGTLRVQKLKD